MLNRKNSNKIDIMKRLALITTLLLFVSFTAAQTSSNIQIDIKNTEPTPLQTSEYADIWLEVTNEGNTAASNVEIRFTENYPFTVDRGDRTNWSIGEIIPGEEYQLHLQTRVDENAVQGNNTLDFEIESGQLTYTESVPVEVRSDRNVLAVENIDFPEKAAPGTSNEMQLTLRNLADSQLKNIQVGLDLSGDIPMATSDASDKNIVSIEPGETEAVNYTLNIDESAENSVYKLPITINFENEAGTGFNQATTTGINVGGRPQLEAGLNSETQLTPGTTTEVTFRMVNRGHGSADFVSMELQENDNVEVIGNNEVYIGSMDSDDFQTASFRVHINAEPESVDIDQIEMPLEVSYTGQDGEQTVSQTVNTQLYTRQQLREYGLVSGGSLIPAVVVLLIVAGAGIYYWRRRKRKNKE